ncbi:MAG TPA: multicopper oxidase family protein [Longimicrobium sp.]|nr:multicopper oxidase family protein [Longimicrobium sp.]
MRVPTPWRAVAVAVLVCASPAISSAQDTLAWSPYAPPTIIASQNGVLSTTLKTGASEVTLNGTKYNVNLYSGSLFPPVLKLQPGDELRLRLVNAMDTTLGTVGTVTNLHFHGFAVSPRQPADDVIHTKVMLDSSYDYRVRLPADHAQGLFWYHPHNHGHSYDQVKAGMAGAITIGDPRRSFPQFAGTPEIFLLLKFFQPNNDDEITVVNGVPRVELPPMRVGEAQFWRIANIAAERYYRLRLVDPAGDSVPFQVLARDGNVVAEGPPVMVSQVLLGAGQRLEAIVQGTRPGYYTLVATDFLRQDSTPDARNPRIVDGAAVLARVRVYPAAAGNAMATVQGQRGGDPAEARTIAALVAARPDSVVRDSIEFEVVRSDQPVQYPIDHVNYNADTISKRFALGQTYVWRIRNVSQSWHTFHLHQTDFLVDSIGGQAMPRDYRLDTVSVPPCTSFNPDFSCKRGAEGVAVIRFHYDRPETVGEFVYHCHMLFHQDNGMMANALLGPDATGGTATGRAHRH